ncbi:MAG: choice-of-anchor Q domain-containing protein [Planctomycetota bacterium]
MRFPASRGPTDLALILLISIASSAHAATISVTTLSDEVNSDGDCSLREAIQAANSDSPVDACAAGDGTDTIIVAPGTYLLGIPGANEDANATGDLDVTSDLALSGAGAADTIIDGANLDRVVHVDPQGAGVSVEISGITIQDGDGGGGGGIRNSGTLTINGCTVLSNTGSGIFNLHNGTLFLNDSTVSGNAAQSGGGVLNSGTGAISNSTITGNAAGSGGGIFNGGLNVATISIDNSTISGNIGSSGGGLNNGNGASAVISNSTVTDNEGGGIVNFGPLSLKNTIVAINGFFGSDNDCAGDPPSSAGHNLDSDGTCDLTASGDITGVDPLLDLLLDNGGPTFTHALLSGSPAIDAGSPDCPPPAMDQRGVPRPQGAACDIGSFESQEPSDVPASSPVSLLLLLAVLVLVSWRVLVLRHRGWATRPLT